MHEKLLTPLSDDRIPLVIAKVFSRSVFSDIVSCKPNQILSNILVHSSLKKIKDDSLGNTLEKLYKIISKKYRNEYVFKNALALEIIKKKHRFKEVSYINELHASRSICDIAIFNGTSTAYEIKTKLDDFSRLTTQLTNYQKIFDKVYVISDNSKLSLLEKTITSNIGICELTEKNRINIIREAESNIAYLSNKAIFYCLRPKEIENIFLERLNHTLPKRASEKRRESLAIFEELDTYQAHEYFVEYMKRRSLKSFEKECFAKLPNSILALLLNLRLNKKKLFTLYEIMNRPYSVLN